MRNIRTSICILALCLLTTVGRAGTITWVSGTGNDSNPCTRVQPCLTFAGALAKTLPGGEIDALDPGDFGPVIISKAVTINGNGFATIVINENLAGDGILVNAGADDVVILRNIEINGHGEGLEGIAFSSGKALQIDHCKIAGLGGDGIAIGGAAGGSVSVLDSVSTNNLTAGLAISSEGAGQVNLTIDRSRFEHNGLAGVIAGGGGRVTVRDSDASDNKLYGFFAEGGDTDAKLNITNSTAGNNQIGILAESAGPGKSIVRLANVAILSNIGAGLKVGQRGIVESFGNNYNSGPGTPTSVVAPQ
jgi:hypothetical protein